MLKKTLSLLLAAGLTLALAACSPADEEQAPEDDAPSVSEPENNQAPDDGDNAPVENEPAGDPSDGDDPSDSAGSGNAAQPGSQPDTQAGSQPENVTESDGTAPPPAEPETPSAPSEPAAPTTPEAPSAPDEAPATPDENAGFTIDDIWADIQAALGDTLPSLSKLDDETMTILYPLSTGDLAEYGCYGSLMNVQASEFFIAKVQSGKMDAVKEAVLTRQSDLEAQWRQYLPAQYELVQNYQLVQNGDYLFFGIAENISAAVDVFNQYTR